MNAPVPCGIRHLDLSRPLPEIHPHKDERALLIYYWEDNVPRGRSLLLTEELPISATGLPAIAAVACAPAFAEPADTTYLPPLDLDHSDVSVIVCTRDRADAIDRSLSALALCDPPPGEIVIVNNDPDPDALAPLVTTYPNMRFVHETRPGLASARNAGIRASSGKVLAFTDDDVSVAPNWIAALLRPFADPSIAIVTGPVLPARLETAAEFAFEFDIGGLASSLVPSFFDKSFLDTSFGDAPPVWKIGAGANMAIRADALRQLGGFDERLGAGTSGCSEDSEAFYRLLGAGWTGRYRPEVVVHHRHRADETAFRRQMRAYMRGHVAALLVQFSENGNSGNLIRAFVGLPAYLAARQVVGWLCRFGFAWIDPHTDVARGTRLAQIGGLLEGYFYWLRWFRSPKSRLSTPELSA